MNFIPNQNKFLVKVDEAPEVSEGGIILADTSKERPNTGVVVKAFMPYTNENGVGVYPVVGKGNKVFFSKYSGTSVILDKVEYLILSTQDLLGYELVDVDPAKSQSPDKSVV